jgi:flagellar basal-body rod modification protein FlgD
MEISSTLTGPAQNTAQNTATKSGVISSDFETFLKMLTVQMQNQDPSDPIKSEDYAVQLATFSGVEQQVRTNELMTAMGAQLGLMSMSQIAGWVGMEARAPVAGYFDGAPISLSPNPPSIADRVDLVVRNTNGVEVQRASIPATSDRVSWAGVADDGTPFAPGLYSFETESFANGAPIGTAKVELYTTIVEARNQGGQTILLTKGGAEVQATQVTALRDPALGV